MNKPKKFAQKRFYIAEKRKGNIIIAVPEGHPMLKKKQIIIKSLHQINPKKTIPNTKLTARIRHLGIMHKGRLIKQDNNYLFIFSKAVEGIAEGQSIVLYNKNKVIAGGEIKN